MLVRSAIKPSVVIILCALLFACIRQSASDRTQVQPCPGLPSTFTSDDLVGTWVASYSLNDTDTIIIKEDGTYKQIYDDPDAGQRYESGWFEWTLEYRENNLARLHLEGMRRAGDLESIFQRDGGGVDPKLYTAIDYCENEVIEMPDEIVLIITGVSYETPRDIILRQARLAGSTWTWSFELLEE